MRRTSLLAGICAGALAASLAAVPSSAREHREPETIVSGLAGPLTLAVHDNSPRVYVTQSFAGLLSKVDRSGTVTDVVVDPNPAGELVGVSLGPRGTYYIDTDFAAGTSHVHRVDSRGRITQVSDNLVAYEARKNPDGGQTYGFVDLSPSCATALAAFEAEHAGMLPPLSAYQGIVESHGYQTTVVNHDVYVADAAANAIFRVDGRSGKISTVAVLPAQRVTFTADILATVEGATELDLPDCLLNATFVPEPVPTDVEIGKDGTLYVSTLEGWLGEMHPLSAVYRVDPKKGRSTWVAGGMHGATGLAVQGKDILVAEMAGGEVSVVKKGRTTATTLFEVPTPADVEVHGRYVYATTDIFANGSVVRLRR